MMLLRFAFIAFVGLSLRFAQAALPDIEALAPATVIGQLNGPLWPDNVYDAGHYLQLPLHVAFLGGHPEWQPIFTDWATRLPEETVPPTPVLYRLQYLLVASRYLVLMAQTGQSEDAPPALAGWLEAQLGRIWLDEPYVYFRRYPNLATRTSWLLTDPVITPAYFAAVDDADLYAYALAADLATWRRLTQDQPSPMVADILTAGDRLIRRVLVPQTDGGLLPQPGVWRDHPDFAFAAQPRKQLDLSPLPGKGNWDSSHAHRWPLILLCMASSFAPEDPRRPQYLALQAAWARQWAQHMLTAPDAAFPAWRVQNFVDGENGVYRWGYNHRPNFGYGAHQLSGTLMLGWWAFLNQPISRTVYQAQWALAAQSWPLPEAVLAVYDGVVTDQGKPAPHADLDYLGTQWWGLLVQLAPLLPDKGLLPAE